jgi:hypothetical protein
MLIMWFHWFQVKLLRRSDWKQIKTLGKHLREMLIKLKWIWRELF